MSAAPFNTAIVDQMIARVNRIQSCDALEALAVEALADMSGVKAAIQAEMTALAPILALLTAPTSPTAVVTWVQNYITAVLTPQYQPYLDYVEKLAALATEVARLTAAIEAKAAAIEHCSFTIPTV